jgi:hypothetical protein
MNRVINTRRINWGFIQQLRTTAVSSQVETGGKRLRDFHQIGAGGLPKRLSFNLRSLPALALYALNNLPVYFQGIDRGLHVPDRTQ